MTVSLSEVPGALAAQFGWPAMVVRPNGDMK
jgi:hypothetical protein